MLSGCSRSACDSAPGTTSVAERPGQPAGKTTDWLDTLAAKRLTCEGRLLPVMEQMNPKIILIMQQMTRHPESAELLNMITSDPDLPLAQAVQILLNAASCAPD